MRKPKISVSGVMTLLTAVFILLGMVPAAAGADVKNASIATIWMAEKLDDQYEQLDWDSAELPIIRERMGFIRGFYDSPGMIVPDEKMVSELLMDTDVTTELAELINNNDILMVVGASGDQATMYAAMETEFFEIPMLIPFSDGVIDTNYSGYTMRMTPTSAKYTDFIGKNLLFNSMKQFFNEILFPTGVIPDYSINVGVLFADNFNGHDLAVSVTQTLMDNGMNIDYYETFEDDIETAFVNAWKNQPEEMENIDVVIIIGYDQDSMNQIDSVLKMWTDRNDPADQPLFLLMAYAPDDQSTDIFNAKNVFALRQHIDMSDCPADILNHDEAIAYAAGWITGLALDRAAAKQSPEPSGWRLWFKTNDQKLQIHQDYLTSFRNNIRTVLMEMQDDIPCFGRPYFNSSSDNRTTVEMVRYTSPDTAEVVDSSEVFDFLLNKIRFEFGIQGD